MAVSSTVTSGALDARGTAARVRPLLVGELVVVAVLLVVYDHVRGLAHVHRAAAVHHGSNILDLEHALHFGIEEAVNHWLSGHAVLGRLSVDYYQYLHVGVAMTLLGVCYVLRPHVYRPARNALVLVNVIGIAIYALYPVAPPRLLPDGGFLDMVADAGFGPHHGGPIPVYQYGAMPSLHIAWAVWVMLVGFLLVEAVWVRCLLVLHPLLTLFVVVGTGNHYVLDAVGGVALAVVAVACVFIPVRRRRAAAGHFLAPPLGLGAAPGPGFGPRPSFPPPPETAAAGGKSDDGIPADAALMTRCHMGAGYPPPPTA